MKLACLLIETRIMLFTETRSIFLRHNKEKQKYENFLSFYASFESNSFTLRFQK